MINRVLVTVFVFALGACANEPPRLQKVDAGILAEMNKAKAPAATPTAQPDEVNLALIPPLRAPLATTSRQPIEAKFDMVVSNGAAREIFMSLVSGTRYSMIVHPDVSGVLSVNLKDVTVREALEAIREVYGYEFKIDGSRIYIQPAGLQTRVFQVNYLTGARQGRSDMRVTSTSVANAGVAGTGATTGTTTTGTAAAVLPGAAGPPSLNPGASGALSGSSAATEAIRLSTVTLTDLWQEIAFSLRAIVGITAVPGTADGRSVIISPQSGVVVVRALPQELRNVENYLKAMRVSVERQVIIEAKIVDVTLSQAYQSGVNWAAFPTSGLAGGFTNSASSIGVTGALTDNNFSGNSTTRQIAAFGAGLAAGVNPAGAFGLAFQTNNFAALLSFLESQGSVQVLSSPRIAATNNQKAVLKIGSDESVIISVSPRIVTPATATSPQTITPGSPTLGTLFSGISLDITPQIDDAGNITLHVHPLISNITQKLLQFDDGGGPRNIQVASAEINESDTIVRARDGNIVVLGGLMKVELKDNRGGIPGVADTPGIGSLFRNTGTSTVKKELIILIKSTVVNSDKDWQQDIQQTSDRLQGYGAVPQSTDRPQ
jgi:MSHA biogenesis protein MshL